MKIGAIKFYNADKGFGFITSGKNEYFFHIKQIDKKYGSIPQKGDCVSFEESNNDKGLTAVYVQRCTAEELQNCY